jgi:D-alanine transaminase
MQIPMLDRAVFFGDGCYDATTFTQHRMFGVEDHFDRFYNSCRMLDIPFSMSREELQDALQRCIDACDSANGMIYWQCSRGTALRSHQYSDRALTPNLLAFAVPLERVPLDRKFRLISGEDVRFFLCNAKTLNLLPNVLAYDDCVRSDCQEIVFYRTGMGQKRVTECAHSNVLMLKNGTLIAPPLDNLILPGITMKHLLLLAEENGIPTARTPFTLEELAEADEVIISSSSALCIAAEELDGQKVGGKDPETLKKLQEAYLAYYETYVGLR